MTDEGANARTTDSGGDAYAGTGRQPPLTTELSQSACDQCADTPAPLTGAIAFNALGERLTLHRGELISPFGDPGHSTAPGHITLEWKRSARLQWSADLSELHSTSPGTIFDWQVHINDRSERPLGFTFGETPSSVAVHVTGEGRGWTNGGVVGDDARLVRRALTHWVNLPALGGTNIHSHTKLGWRTWPGRAEFEVQDWHLTFDARPDLNESLQAARDDEAWVMTHVMELRRHDERPFSAEEAATVVAAVQFASSFALGYWAAPVALTGFDPDTNAPVWAEWRPMYLDPPNNGSGWWDRHRVDPDLDTLLDVFVSAWSEPSERLWLMQAVATAVSAVRTGFMEQRLTSVMSVLEMLSWLAEVRDGGRPEEEWGDEALHVRLDRMLATASVAAVIDPRTSPSLRAFARKRNHARGPQALTELRNLVTHPKDNSGLYEDPKTLGEAARLARLYLELLVLHRIRYHGKYENHTDLAAWRGQSIDVPWRTLNST